MNPDRASIRRRPAGPAVFSPHRLYTVLIGLLLWLIIPGPPPWAGTLMLTDELTAKMKILIETRITTPPGADTLTCRLVRPPNYNSPAVSQKADPFFFSTQPKPDRTGLILDRAGNRVQILEFKVPPEVIAINRGYIIDTARRPHEGFVRFPFPPRQIPPAVGDYLKDTDLVQSEARAIANLGRYLVQGLESQEQAVTMIMSWLVDNVLPVPNSGPRDALATLRAGKGSAEGLAHLPRPCCGRSVFPRG